MCICLWPPGHLVTPDTLNGWVYFPILFYDFPIEFLEDKDIYIYVSIFEYLQIFNGKDYPIYDMENKKMFQTTNQS